MSILPDSTRCQVPMVHPDATVAWCIRHKDHLRIDSDHLDEHGHTAPVLVSQSTIREVQRVQDMRDRGEIT
jgi:hypothetical protein